MSADQPTTHLVEPPINPATSPSQRRRRPLRTYGRRSTQTREQAPELSGGGKSHRSLDSDSRCAESIPESTRLPKQESRKLPKHGSILAYFKPLSPGFDTAGSNVLPSDLVQPASTPRLSPPPLSKPRKRRRLTTRPLFSEEERYWKDVAEVDGNLNDLVADGDCSQSYNSPTNRPTIDTRSATLDTVRSALSDMEANVLHRGTRLAGTMADQGLKVGKPPEKRSARDMTQTTLSLSVQKDPGFTICTVCDILYNPLNEKDRREHKRRHAAYSRTKGKALKAEICEDGLKISLPNSFGLSR
ncbi:hypothetical protein MFIFM68171_07704 [Madurella fahalii]|uniref:N-acetyltransferase ESCO zinc-finger domain-containing protein n=1 Tax=Madurella fahalii TaxID=1157608 RepID=A0ABQ0GIA7_9PEZI